VPFGTNNAGIFYRPLLFKAARISQLPQTWIGYSRISDSIGRAIESILLAKSDPQTALNAAQRRLDLIFRAGLSSKLLNLSQG
jgi:ABC-type glycerol-3-phosphate transport system substrate-binding protein